MARTSGQGSTLTRSRVEIPSYRFQDDGVTVRIIGSNHFEFVSSEGNEFDARTLLAAGTGSITLEIDAEVASETYEHVLPPDQVANPPVALYLVEESDRSRRRFVHQMTAVSRGHYKLSLDLEIGNEFGEIVLTPILIRTSLTAESPYASHPSSKLATGEPLQVYVDDKPPKAGRYLNIEYHSFAEGGKDGKRAELKALKHLLYHLETKPSGATLLLNSDIENLQATLNSPRTARGKDKRIKDATFATIRAHVWQQLYERSAAMLQQGFREAEFTPGSGDATEDAEEWAKETVESLARALYDSPQLADCVSEFEMELAEKPAVQQKKVSRYAQEVAAPKAAFKGLVMMRDGQA